MVVRSIYAWWYFRVANIFLSSQYSLRILYFHLVCALFNVIARQLMTWCALHEIVSRFMSPTLLLRLFPILCALPAMLYWMQSKPVRLSKWLSNKRRDGKQGNLLKEERKMYPNTGHTAHYTNYTYTYTHSHIM